MPARRAGWRLHNLGEEPTPIITFASPRGELHFLRNLTFAAPHDTTLDEVRIRFHKRNCGCINENKRSRSGRALQGRSEREIA
jgi:hypothetical protein